MISKIGMVVTLIFLTLANRADARGIDSPVVKPRQADWKDSLFVSAYWEYLDGIRSGRDIRIEALQGEAGYYLWKNVAVIGNVFLIETEGERVVVLDGNRITFDAGSSGWGLSLGLRFNIIRRQRTKLFIDAGGGLLYTSAEFPPGGTDWNYTFRPGIGASVRLWNSVALTGGLRYMHISNGKEGRGFEPNPAYDGFGVFIGVLYGF